MIFSHVLYQLSYLAYTKKPAQALLERGREACRRRRRSYRRLSGPARFRGLHVSPTIQKLDACTVFPRVISTWETPPAAALHEQIAGAGFEPATFGL